MAKVTSPLLSGKARGQIMKSLVFFPWKSINAVRGYVVPADPNTSGQQAQRTKMTNAVAEWHDAAYSAKDKTAWNKWASTLAAIMSGFNAMVRVHIANAIAGDTYGRICNVTESAPGATDVDILAETNLVGVEKATLHWGTSPTFMPNEDEVTCSVSSWQFDMSGLTDGVTYYYYINMTEAAHGGRTGVYKYLHVAP